MANGLVDRPGQEQSSADNERSRPSVDELILTFWKHAEAHYRDPDGSPTGEVENFRQALKPVRRLYGHTRADRFGPLDLRAVRDEYGQLRARPHHDQRADQPDSTSLPVGRID
jgi:hypothetical protein